MSQQHKTMAITAVVVLVLIALINRIGALAPIRNAINGTAG